ncbi:hypothetical protein HPB48_018008 [Haemaphysalis longicornis]|uniref:Uncharacterized protein n=1 Tax=Haemaphysalis longicornis TaxID=44386 RepID=A0A9J6FK71_HAELO|nr:hypothetical protein HPB48_018008 [Haemaphysalis longicornis]
MPPHQIRFRRGTSGSRRGSPQHTCRFRAVKSAGADGAAIQAGSKGGTERAKYKRRFGRSASVGRECVSSGGSSRHELRHAGRIDRPRGSYIYGSRGETTPSRRKQRM